jgi:hypothetical protein
MKCSTVASLPSALLGKLELACDTYSTSVGITQYPHPA